MIISIASFKGGVGKTTTAVHLAAFLQTKGETLLVDDDPNRSALHWQERGELSFKVVTTDELAKFAPTAEHIVIDTPARPKRDDLKILANESDVLLIPATPDALSLDAMLLIVGTLKTFEAKNFRILLTQIPPRSNAGRDARALLESMRLPVCKAEIHRRAVFGRAALGGATVDRLKDGGDSWLEYAALGKELLEK